MSNITTLNAVDDAAPSEQELIELLENARLSYGHRRPHVRAAIDLAKLAIRDPFLKSDPTSSFRATMLASQVLKHIERKLPNGIKHHALNARKSSSFEHHG